MSLDSKDVHLIIVMVVFLITITIILGVRYLLDFDIPTVTLISGTLIGFWVVMRQLHLLD